MKFFKYLFFLSSLILFLFGLLLQDINILFISLIVLYLASVLYSIESIKTRIVYLFFLITFFIFLLSRYFIGLFFERKWWEPFTKNTMEKTLICLFISLFFILLGYFFFSNKKQSNLNLLISNDGIVQSICLISKCIFYVTFLPAFYVLLNRIIFVQSYGYAESYIQYAGVTLLLSRMASVNLISFFLFLASMPRKRETMVPVFLIAIYSVAALFTGARSTTITLLLVLLYYYIFRDSIDSVRWIRKKTLIIIALLTPFVIIFLSFWGFYRVNRAIDGVTLGKLFLNFFESQGNSANIISYSIDREGQFPATNISYTFGPIINFLKYNVVSQQIFDFNYYPQNTVGAALFGNDLSQTITYMVMPWNYSEGIGMGSSYIAEVYIDFGYFGLIIFNLFFGFILGFFNKINLSKPWKFALMLVVLKSILTMPRSSALLWFTDAINIVNILTILIIYLMAYLFTNYKKGNLIKNV